MLYWDCNYNCSFCLCLHETTEHILTTCNYTEVAWNLVAMKFDLPLFSNLPAAGGPSAWVTYLLSTGSSLDKKRKLGVLLIFWWKIWKERNCRIFDNKCLSAQQLASVIAEEVKFQLQVYSYRTDHA
jgi:hypothetical protein